nr:retrovirus-related Pol polyprotein [Tanacetum cinerariifolium]
SGTLPGNTITNPKEDLKGITTRSDVAYQGPIIPTLSKVVKQGIEFASTLKALIRNKKKLSEMAKTPMNEHCSAVILNKLLKKLGDPGKFLIPCEFPGIDECLALADLAITYNLDQTSRYSANYDQMTTNKIDVTDEACEEYSQEVLDFSNVTASDSPTPSDDPIVSTTSPTLNPFGDSDFLLFEEANAFLGLEDNPDSPKLDPSYYDPEGDIQMLEAILNSDPTPSLPDHEQSVPSFKNELKACEDKTIKAFIDEPPEIELKDLPLHLEYAFLEGDNKLPVIIAKELRDEEKAALIKVLKSHKRAIAWKLSDIQGINPEFYTHKILMEEDYKPAVQHQRRVNPKIHDVIKKEKGGFTVVKNEENELIPTRLVTEWRGTSTIVSSMVSLGIFKFPLTLVIKKKQRLPALMGRSPTVACLSVCAMRRERFKDKMLQRCEDTKLCLNWEKSHFMVKEGIVLGHKISRNGIEVDKAKVDVITKLPHPTTVKGVRSFLGHAGFYRRFIKDFSKISRPMTHLLEKDTPFIFFEDCIKAFQTLKQELT